MVDNKRVHAVVEGIVQGVGYRFFAFQVGKSRGLKGWVRNRVNGTVEVKAQGSESDINFFLNELERGPEMAQVSNISIEWFDQNENLPDFTILETT